MYNIEDILIVATKPIDILSRYLVGQIYIFEKIRLKKPARYMFIQNIE